MSRIRWYGPTLLLLFTVVLAMVLGPSMVRQIARSYESARVEQVRQGLAENPTLSTLSDAFKDVATVMRPSVTSISLQARSRGNGGRLGEISNGSGWVYRHFNSNDPDDADDFIITNHHVIEAYLQRRAEQIVVRFNDGGEYQASVVGSDKRTDVAVLTIDRKGLIPAALAEAPAQQGEIVFAIGSPFQFDFSMSQGIVSATGRRIHDPRLNLYENFIQTDAAINPGNSGGPLTNVRGEVIGMNTAIAIDGNPAQEFSGLGFAIPIDQIVKIANQLIENGEVKRGYMGVGVMDVDYPTAQELGFEGKGVLATPVPGGPADEAGIQLGDIITHVAGVSVATSEDLRIEVAGHAPGTVVPIRLWRRGRPVVVRLTLIEFPEQLALGGGGPGLDDAVRMDRDNAAALAGLGGLESFTPALAAFQGWAYTPGVLVRMIENSSPADRAGLLRMSIITRVGNQPIHDLAGFAQAIEGLNGQSLTITVKRWDRSGNAGYVETQYTLSAE